MIAVLNNGLALLGVSSDRVQIIKGLVLLVAVGIDVYSQRRGRPSIIGRFPWRSTAAGLPGDEPLPSSSVPPKAPTP